MHNTFITHKEPVNTYSPADPFTNFGSYVSAVGYYIVTFVLCAHAEYKKLPIILFHTGCTMTNIWLQ